MPTQVPTHIDTKRTVEKKSDLPKSPQLPRSGKASLRTEQWAAEAASRTSSQFGDDERFERASLAEVVSTAAAAGAAAAIKGQNSLSQGNTSIYELVKLIERRRPTVKFEGKSKTVDFEDHFISFKRSVDLPGLPATWKLAEIPHWFGGVAKVNISHFLRREDAEKAFGEALERLKKEYGRKVATADEMMSDILQGGKIDVKDATGTILFISRVEEVYNLALETKREDDFNRRSLYNRIMMAKLPHLRLKWATCTSKRDDAITFPEFLEFLVGQKRISSDFDDMTETLETSERKTPTTMEQKTPMTESKSFATVVKDAARGNVDAEGFETVQRRGGGGGAKWPRSGNFDSSRAPNTAGRPEGDQRRTRKLECFCCKQEHQMQYCPNFIGSTPTERLAIVKEKSLCLQCMAPTHQLKDCQSRVRCYCGEAGHHPTLHGGQNGQAAVATDATAGAATDS